MNLTNLTAALLLVTSACGAVVDPTENPAPTPGGPTLEEPPVGPEDEPPAAPSPLLIDAPRAATTPGSLFSMTFDNGAPLFDIVTVGDRQRIDIVEQKIITVTDREIQLSLELTAPTGSYSRTLVSDAVRHGLTHTEHVLCEYNGFSTFDPRCETADPVARELPSTGTLTAGEWNLTVIDDATGVPLTSCISPGPNKLSCVLPARASATYRVITSAHGFGDLWDGTVGFSPNALFGVPYFGVQAEQPDWQCWDWRVSGSSMWCAARYEYLRFTAIDRARLDFDPITVRITANGSASAMPSPALTWDPGNDDVPGSTF